jgi:hypothetical protein
MLAKDNETKSLDDDQEGCHCEEPQATKQSLGAGKDCFAEFILSLAKDSQ